MKKLFIILATAALAASCLNPNTPTERTFETDSTVNAYFKFIRKEEGKLPLHTIMVADATIEELLIMLSLVGNNLGSIYDVMDNPNGDKAKAFLAAQEKFGDHNPNKSLFRFYENKNGGEWQLESGQCIYYAFGEQISKITITSSRDWAPGYPAGTDLAPLFNAEYGALSNYIQSGYDKESYLVHRGILGELTAKDFAPMLESDWNIYGGTDLALYTTTFPADYYDHTITVSLILDTDEVISYSEKLVDILMW